jgi:hypothetical protein
MKDQKTVSKVVLTEEQRLLREVDKLMIALLRPVFVHRMASARLSNYNGGEHLTDSQRASALTRRRNGAREIDAIVRAYVTGQLD